MKQFVGMILTSLVLLAGCGAEDRSSSETAKPDLERYRRNPSLRTTAPAEVFAPIATNNPEKIIAMGERYYQRVCATCHDHGFAGAPILGDADAWETRLAKGTPKLVQNAVDGLGEMPPRGGDPNLRKEAVRLAVEYMVEQVR
jgi:cytochrome c5